VTLSIAAFTPIVKAAFASEHMPRTSTKATSFFIIYLLPKELFTTPPFILLRLEN
jgi:hypothetical protein